MRLNSSNEWNHIEFVPLKGENWLIKQRIAGAAVAACLSFFKDIMSTRLSKVNLLDIESECEKIIDKYHCTPTFKNYKGFPGAVCLSVNKDLVHGIPRDYTLKEGDVVTLDLGATFEGAIADAAVTKIFGTPRNKNHTRLVEAAHKCLMSGINAIKVGKPLGVIGNAIYKCAKQYSIDNFHLITNYGGHGIGWNRPHSSPFVSNKSNKTDGITIQPGLVIAIEPMLVIGGSKTKTKDDGWTVSAAGISAHAEHSVFIHENDVEIITG